MPNDYSKMIATLCSKIVMYSKIIASSLVFLNRNRYRLHISKEVLYILVRLKDCKIAGPQSMSGLPMTKLSLRKSRHFGFMATFL